MATHKSAMKRHRQSLKRRERNRLARSTARTAIKEALALAEKGDVKGAAAAAKKATSLIDKAAIHSIVHKKNAARKISRMHQKINQLQAAKA